MRKVIGWVITIVVLVFLYWGWIEAYSALNPWPEQIKWSQLTTWDKPLFILYNIAAFFILWLAILGIFHLKSEIED